jgi:hypothetical protein
VKLGPYIPKRRSLSYQPTPTPKEAEETEAEDYSLPSGPLTPEEVIFNKMAAVNPYLLQMAERFDLVSEYTGNIIRAII